MRTIILLSCLFMFGCASVGPVSSPMFNDMVEKALPGDSGEVKMYGPGFWFPNTRGFTDVRSQGMNRGQAEISGVLVVTDKALFVCQWSENDKEYYILKRFMLYKVREFFLDSYGVNRRVAIQWKDYSTDTFSFSSDSGQTIDVEKTLKLYELISGSPV